ncbi:hypothetical protein H6G41_19860 [Tolypothrix sp. FACHB-123]|uniref:hypothetical protein n=1 Tax=Tolypothrix sp. FACHB-123 TaxID=2692868 RepID=UPI00168217BD|nr:hypothetical protein [Tolypothrix sp. FACHB-123]MBD2356855.1 hypothetical protein [Tolypothrix sp. FACHB-123]
MTSISSRKPTQKISKVSNDLLERITDEFINILRRKPGPDVFDWSTKKDYHGFEKTLVRKDILQPFIEQYNLAPEALEISIVRIKSNYPGSVHVHPIAHALCPILGEVEGFPNPVNAYALVEENWSPVSESDSMGIAAGKGKWFPINAGDRVYNPTNVAHGFTVQGEGQCYFVCIQSPNIDQATHDDWLPAKVN